MRLCMTPERPPSLLESIPDSVWVAVLLLGAGIVVTIVLLRGFHDPLSSVVGLVIAAALVGRAVMRLSSRKTAKPEP